jgi:hypothetical protein
MTAAAATMMMIRASKFVRAFPPNQQVIVTQPLRSARLWSVFLIWKC